MDVRLRCIGLDILRTLDIRLRFTGFDILQTLDARHSNSPPCYMIFVIEQLSPFPITSEHVFIWIRLQVKHLLHSTATLLLPSINAMIIRYQLQLTTLHFAQTCRKTKWFKLISLHITFSSYYGSVIYLSSVCHLAILSSIKRYGNRHLLLQILKQQTGVVLALLNLYNLQIRLPKRGKPVLEHWTIYIQVLI
jgi:hypothetical protein